MKKKIAILGSTGSIGKTTFNIIKNNPNDFEILLLTTNKNVNTILKQAKMLKVKNTVYFMTEYYAQYKTGQTDEIIAKAQKIIDLTILSLT